MTWLTDGTFLWLRHTQAWVILWKCLNKNGGLEKYKNLKNNSIWLWFLKNLWWLIFYNKSNLSLYISILTFTFQSLVNSALCNERSWQRMKESSGWPSVVADKLNARFEAKCTFHKLTRLYIHSYIIIFTNFNQTYTYKCITCVVMNGCQLNPAKQVGGWYISQVLSLHR